jgi:hypothetical protein
MMMMMMVVVVVVVMSDFQLLATIYLRDSAKKLRDASRPQGVPHCQFCRLPRAL